MGASAFEVWVPRRAPSPAYQRYARSSRRSRTGHSSIRLALMLLKMLSYVSLEPPAGRLISIRTVSAISRRPLAPPTSMTSPLILSAPAALAGLAAGALALGCLGFVPAG